MVIKVRDFCFLQDGTSRKLSCQIGGGRFPDRLFFECNANALPESTAPSGNFALVGLLYPAMALGEDLEINAPVSPLLLHTIQHDVQSLLIDYNPELKRIKVSATSVTLAPLEVPSDVATGFSAGVDTFTTLTLFTANDVPDSRHLTSLTTFDVGAMGNVDDSSEIFEKYSRRLRDYAKDNDFLWQTARSNLDQFYSAVSANFQTTHVIRNVAAALIFEDIFGCYLYSSSYPYRNINSKNDDMSYIEPIILPLLSTETLQFVSAGAGLARVQKTELISTSQSAMKMLDVCVASANVRMKSKFLNCSRCWKCSRMMVNLDVLGRIDDFAGIFDLEYYRSNKDHMFLNIFESAQKGKPADQDLMALMRERNFNFKIPRVSLLKSKLSMQIINVKNILSDVPGLKTLYRTIRRRK